jgi:hypothetical protein
MFVARWDWERPRPRCSEDQALQKKLQDVIWTLLSQKIGP